MKYLAVITAVMALGVSGASAYQTTPEQQVSVALTTADVRQTPSVRTDVLLVWNRNERSRPIGHAVKACIKVGSGGVLGGGVMSCTLNLSMPLGKIVAVGVIHNLGRYTLTITGGTGAYEGVTGPLFVRRVADGVRRLTFEAT